MIRIENIFSGLGQWGWFVWESAKCLKTQKLNLPQLKNQMIQVGFRSVPITCVAGLFVGAILAIQIDSQLKDFGAQSFLGGLSTSTTLRNLGPVLIAFLLAGRVGAYTSAELGTMAITDQLNAIRCLGLNPLVEIVVPRLIALVLSSFFLLILGLGMTVVGGVIIASLALQVNPLQFMSRVTEFLTLGSVLTSLIKSFVFGMMIGSVSCFFGFNTSGGAAEVGSSVRKTAVALVIAIILADFLISWMGGCIQK